jgi:hypothetical protein
MYVEATNKIMFLRQFSAVLNRSVESKIYGGMEV